MGTLKKGGETRYRGAHADTKPCGGTTHGQAREETATKIHSPTYLCNTQL